MSRTVKIILAALAIILILALIYFFFLRKGGEEGIIGSLFGNGGGTLPDTGGQGGPGGGQAGGGGGTLILPGGTTPVSQDEERKLIQLTKDPVFGLAVKEKDNKIMYFKMGTGHLFESDFGGEGNENRISNLTIPDVFYAAWSPSGSYAFLTALDADSTKNYWFHISSTSTIDSRIFQNKIVSAAFSPSEERIASLVNVNGTYSLYTSNPDGTKAKTLLSTKVQDFEVSWIAKNLLALKTKTSALVPSLLQVVSSDGSNPFVLLSEYTGFDALWNSDGSSFIGSKTTRGKNLELFLQERDSGKVTEITFKTLPEKCTFSSKRKNVVFCALPADESVFSKYQLPDDWWQGKFHFQDELWEINLETGDSELLLSGGGFDITNIIPSPNENYVFFINKRDSTLWSFRIL